MAATTSSTHSLWNSQRSYSTELGPEKDYAKFVDKWIQFFQTVDEDSELERGLNQVFAFDWVPALEVVEESLKASRRLNSFATAVRVLEAVEEKVEKKGQYTQYLTELKPLLEELGVPERKELGNFNYVRQKIFWVDTQ